MKKIFIEVHLIIFVIIMAFLFHSKIQKDEWVKEPPEIKYSKERMEEVWGGALRGHNPDLFYGTPLHNVAKAMSGLTYFRNEEKIERLIDEIPKEYINYQEGYYGHTIGHFALRTYNYSAIRKLLDKGLNPNLMDKSGDAIIIDINSSTYSYKSPESLKTLKYMIQKGANVNLYSKKAQLGTPLIEASYSNFENVKILVEAGANPYFIDEAKEYYDPFRTPLRAALVSKRIEIVNYLVFNQKVDFRTKHSLTSMFHPGEYEILYDLREMFFELNSKKYQEKMKLVAYLKTQGLDYWKTPIQERFRNNPNYTKEYLSKY
jgi:hypothetical protein